MKSFRLWTAAGCAIIIFTAGCATGPTRTATRFAAVETPSTGADKGYVQFTTREKEASLPIYRIDENQRPQVLGVIGLREGDLHLIGPGESEAPIVETLRVAVPPGRHTFILQRDGKSLTVPVVEGKVTPVEVDYVVIEMGELAVVYRVDATVLEPTAP